MRTLVFRWKGPMAHFRRVYTTTSASTYSFPPRTSILGLVGAVLGIESRPGARHLEVLKDLNVSVIVENRVDKTRIPVNFHSTKDSGKRLQIPLEVIRNPSYTVFVGKFQFFDELKRYLMNRESVFTPYLGLSEFIATLEYIGEYDTARSDLPCEVHSVVPSSRADIVPKKGVLYLKERATRSMDALRNYTEHETYILTQDGSPIEIEEGEVYQVGDWRIIWM